MWDYSFLIVRAANREYDYELSQKHLSTRYYTQCNTTERISSRLYISVLYIFRRCSEVTTKKSIVKDSVCLKETRRSWTHLKVKKFTPVPLDTLEGVQNTCHQMEIMVHIFGQSLLSFSFVVLHSTGHTKSGGSSCVKNEKRALETKVQTLP